MQERKIGLFCRKEEARRGEACGAFFSLGAEEAAGAEYPPSEASCRRQWLQRCGWCARV